MGKYSGILSSVIRRSEGILLSPDKSRKEAEFYEKGELEIPDYYHETVREILTIFTQISKRYEPVNEKGAAICELLDSYGIEYYKQSVPRHEYNIVTLSSYKAEKVIMSHYDLIPIFNAGFLASDCLRFDGDEIQGALDNTITNAVVLYMLKNKLIPSNTSVVFSVEEEQGGAGAKEFMNRLQDKDSVAFINLDVTNEFKDCDRTGMSIEYDAFSVQNIPLLWGFCDSGFSSVTFERVGDDMCTILRYGGRGASFCLPTKKGIHSFKNKTTADKLYKYTLELERILNSNIDFSLENESRRVSLSEFKVTRGLSSEDIFEQFKPYSSQSRMTGSLFDRDWMDGIERSVFGSDFDEDEDDLMFELAECWSDDSRGCESLTEALGQWISGSIDDSGLNKAFIKANQIVGGKWFHKFLEEAVALKKNLNNESAITQHPFDDDADELDEALNINTLADLYSSSFEEMDALIKHINLWIAKSISKNDLIAAFKSIPSNVGGIHSESYLKDFLSSCKAIKKSKNKSSNDENPFDRDIEDLSEYSEMDIADAFVSESVNVPIFAEHIKMWKQGLYADMQLEGILKEVSFGINDDDLASFWRYAYSLLGTKSKQ